MKFTIYILHELRLWTSESTILANGQTFFERTLWFQVANIPTVSVMTYKGLTWFNSFEHWSEKIFLPSSSFFLPRKTLGAIRSDVGRELRQDSWCLLVEQRVEADRRDRKKFSWKFWVFDLYPGRTADVYKNTPADSAAISTRPIDSRAYFQIPHDLGRWEYPVLPYSYECHPFRG